MYTKYTLFSQETQARPLASSPQTCCLPLCVWQRSLRISSLVMFSVDTLVISPGVGLKMDLPLTQSSSVLAAFS